ncbi:hypothetical protein Hdeb2414_s0407g00887561 [Helianthus debilis subsp. tardiflorus]
MNTPSQAESVSLWEEGGRIPHPDKSRLCIQVHQQLYYIIRDHPSSYLDTVRANVHKTP